MEDKQYKLMANAVRFLSIEAVEKANSGHPGMPMGMADVATILFAEFLKFDAQNPKWDNRDRFILSAGHGSMLLYSILYLTGYPDINIEDIKKFRQLGSKTAGHPEYGLLQGIETTTGPLGQGLGNAVGMAIAEKLLAARLGDDKVDHFTYVIVGDGCLMEGISQEAISLAGHLGLKKLVVLYDDNQISIDGPTNLTISEDVLARFKASNWNAERIDGHEFSQIRSALSKAKQSEKPTLIACRTIIGFGSPKKGGTEHCHGSPLGKEEIEQVKKQLNWPYAAFEVPAEILDAWRSLGCESTSDVIPLNNSLVNYQHVLSDLKKEFSKSKANMPTRKASGMALDSLTKMIPEMIGGSADLSISNNTQNELNAIKADDFSGRYIYYGVREHAMCAIMNGLALHKNFIPYGGSFLVFSDYCRPAIRLASIMGLQVFYVMTHDSIGLGEDGPTHQPVEHLSSLRAMPNLYVFRPACAIETAECYEMALQISDAPSLFSLTRQDVPFIRDNFSINLSELGAYVISEYDNELKVTIFATGSEVHIALDAQKKLHACNIGTRVVSMPCWKLFDQQSNEYQSSLLDNSSLKVAVEAASRHGWDKYIGREGVFVGLQDFGASAPANDLYHHFCITAEDIVNQILQKVTFK